MASVAVAAGARRDIKKIAGFLAEHGGPAPAVSFTDSIAALRVRLEAFPQSYATRRGLGSDVRVAVIAPYLVLYRYRDRDDRVVILRVLHGHRNVTADFLKMR